MSPLWACRLQLKTYIPSCCGDLRSRKETIQLDCKYFALHPPWSFVLFVFLNCPPPPIHPHSCSVLKSRTLHSFCLTQEVLTYQQRLGRNFKSRYCCHFLGHASHLTCPDLSRIPNGFSALQARDWFIIGTQIDGGGRGAGNSPWALPERENAGWIWLSAVARLLILSFRTADQPDATKTSMTRTRSTLARLKCVFLLNLSHNTVVNYTTPSGSYTDVWPNIKAAPAARRTPSNAPNIRFGNES